MTIVTTVAGVLQRAAINALRQVIGPVVGACVVGYFAYYAVQGDRGLMAMRHLQSEIAEAEAILREVEADRERMERRARLLRADNLDRDMLEERARALLNLGHARDVVVTLPRLPELPEDAADGAAGPRKSGD